MRSPLLAILITALATCPLRSQEPGQTRQPGSISGSVIDGVSQQPLRDVPVFLRRIRVGPADGSFSPKGETGRTDSSGRFSFENLDPGRFLVSASPAGYATPGLVRKMVVLEAGQRVDDVVIRVMPGAAVSGHVADTSGKALSGVTVEIVRHRYRFGKTELSELSSATTGKTGEYRIGGLGGGKYYVRAISSQPPGGKTVTGDGYVPTYYPGTRDAASSIVLTVRPGDEIGGIDLTLTPVHTVAVRGSVVDSVTRKPSAGAEVTLVDEEGSIASFPYEAAADAKGNFELRGIPAGDYILIAEKPSRSEREKTVWGRRAIRVGKSNIQDVVVMIAPGVEVSGRIRVEGKNSVDLTHVSASLESMDSTGSESFVPGVEHVSIRADGTFVFQDVAEGRYAINLASVPAGFYVKGTGSADMADAGIAVARGQALSGLDLALTPGAPRVRGTVSEDQQPAPDVPVVLVPTDERRGQARYFRQSVSDPRGQFTLRSVPPGDYEIFAWDVERSAFTDPDFMQQAESQGKMIHLKEGDDVSVDLEPIPTSESP